MANKMRIMVHYLKYKNVSRFKTKEDVKVYQKKGIKKLFKHLNRHSPYYHKLLKKDLCGSKIKQMDKHIFSKLPIMDKVTMMANFDELVCVDITKEEAFEIAISSEKNRDFKVKKRGITVGLSSGTSAHRGLFIVSKKEADEWTGTILGRMLPQMSKHHEIAFFLRANSNLYENVKTSRIGFTYYDIYKPMTEHLVLLEQSQPDIIIGPSSVLMIIAEAIYSKRIALKPNKVISVAEVLEEKDGAFLREQFQVEVIHQVYQATEGFLGYTCEFGTLHINEDVVLIEEEFIDEKRFIPIITDFTRRSQPIVRYRLNDILVHKMEPCPCGCPFMALEKIEGREDDLFIFTNIEGEEVKLFPDIIRRSVLYVEGISNYEVIQLDGNKIQINLEYDTRSLKEILQQNLIKEFQKVSELFNLEALEITFGDYTHDSHKKMKRVRRA